MDHLTWNGCILADFVMPFFLFIVGVAIPFAMKRVPNLGAAVKKLSVRTLKMLFWGLLLQGGYSHALDDLAYGVDMKVIRWCAILQRIAWVYFVVALIEVFTIKVRPATVRSGPYAVVPSSMPTGVNGATMFPPYLITMETSCHFLTIDMLGGSILFAIYMVMAFSLYGKRIL